MTIPQDVIDNCAQYRGCRGCPLGTCVAPVTHYPSEQWNAWLKERIETIRELKS